MVRALARRASKAARVTLRGGYSLNLRLVSQARNEEKAQSMLNRFLQAKTGKLTYLSPPPLPCDRENGPLSKRQIRTHAHAGNPIP